MEECLRWFPAQQREKASKLKGSRLIEAVAGYDLLVTTMRETGMLEELPMIALTESGKPYMTNYADYHFNLSHCRTHIALALSGTPVGIDVESTRKVSPSLIKRVCSAAEQQMIAESAKPDMEFLRLWTRKEAYLKYTGTGIVEPLTNIPPQVSDLRSPITGHRSQVTDHQSLVTGHRSQVTGHWSLVTGHTIKTHPLPEGDGWVSVCW